MVDIDKKEKSQEDFQKLPEVKPISSEELERLNIEFKELRKEMQYMHTLFYELFCMGLPHFTRELPTAGISFEPTRGGYAKFLWNPDFWDSLNYEERAFVTCHEVLHVMFSHGVRGLNKKEFTPEIRNIAMDIVVNHTLIDNFGFDKDSLEVADMLIWKDKVFENPDEIEDDREFEYYLDKILEQAENNPNGDGIPVLDSVDNHDGLNSFESDRGKKFLDKIIDDNLTDQEKEDFYDKVSSPEEREEEIKQKGNPQAGTAVGRTCFVVKKEKPKYQVKWASVVKKWKQMLSMDQAPVEAWHNIPRKYQLISNNGFMLPGNPDDIGMEEKPMVNVWWFQDISGSCIHMVDKFYNAARTFPLDMFKVRAFSFDTKVREIDITKNEVLGGGGTSFHIIEDYIQEKCVKEKIKYPDAVFVFTDGYGTDVFPQYPKRWHIFLEKDTYTNAYSTVNFPKECGFHNFQDFA